MNPSEEDRFGDGDVTDTEKGEQGVANDSDFHANVLWVEWC